MIMLRNSPTIPALLSLACLTLTAPTHAVAAPSARAGAISVAEVTAMLDQAPSNRIAQQVLTAYLAGIGETAGTLVDLGGVRCQRPLALSADNARHAIAASAAATAATPLVVSDLLARAGCRRR